MATPPHAIPTFRTIFWYGERFYSAYEVDIRIRNASRDLERAVSQLVDARSNVQMIRNLYSASSDYWTAIANEATPALHLRCGGNFAETPTDSTAASHPAMSLQDDPSHIPADSPRSSCSSNNRSCGRASGGGGGARGRTIGKRNQEFYIPHGVLLSHTVHDGADHGDEGAELKVQREWFGRYDRLSNTIIRVTADVGADAEVGVDGDVAVEYETLKHFAQEHDREMCQERHEGLQEYRECNTPNVWTNPQFKFYNTVSLKWEPLSALRTAN
jgi:hypothetical protein